MRKLLEIFGIGALMFVALSILGGVVDASRTRFVTPAPVALPPPTATAAPRALSVTPKGQAVNVRQGPGTDYSVVMTLDEDQSAVVIGRNVSGDWLQIPQGWVNTIMVREMGDTDQVPVVNVTRPQPAMAEQAAPNVGAIASTDSTASTASTTSMVAAAGPSN